MSIEKKILPETKFIWEFLQLESNNKFVIPAYQREYSWTYKVQCEKLWQDIEEYDNSDSNDPYFFGTIIEDCSPEHNNELYLIDGQQRTTTFLLILKALQLKLNEVLKNFKLTGSNQGQYDDLKIFRTQTIELLFKFMRDGQRTEQIINNWDEHKNEICILENRSNNEEHKDELETILRSRSFDEAEKNCYKNPKRKLDNRFTNYFKNFRFFYRDKIDILNESQVNSIAKTFLTKCQVIVIKTWRVDQAITMFNSLNSTGMPLSDSNILSAQLYESARKLNLNSFDDLWREIIRASSTLETEGICDINSILQQYMYIYRALNKEYLKDSNTIDITTPGVRRYYMEINKNLSNDPEHLCKEFLKILNIWDKIKEYDITKLILKFNENVKLFLISYLYRFAPEDINEQLVEDFSKYLIRLFAVMEIVETGYSSKHFKSFLFAENIKIVDKKISLTELEDDFDKHIKSTWDKEELIERIKENYNGNVLVHLNEYLYSKSKNTTFKYSASCNIEHIMPSSGKEIATIMSDAGFINNKEGRQDFDACVNKIGNKILLEENINKSIGNKWFRTKKSTSVKNKTGYKDSIYAIAKSLSNYNKDVWEVEDIVEATNKAADRIATFIIGS